MSILVLSIILVNWMSVKALGGIMNFMVCKFYALFIIMFSINGIFAAYSFEPWTWLYQKKLTDEELIQNEGKKELIFSHATHNFSQLVFSWNALRPKKGNFIFFAQTRDAGTKSWGVWHKMMAWGSTLQESYKTAGDGYSRNYYVRLETEPNIFADAFRIKIVAKDKADMALFKAFTVSVSNFSKFKAEESKLYQDFPSLYIDNVPKYSQFLLNHPRNDSLCSPTSCSMVTGFLSKSEIDPIDFAEKSFDYGLGVYGSWPFNTAHAFERCQGSIFFAAARFDSFKRVYSCLQKGVPVVVSVRGPLKGAAGQYAHGHLLAIVGWDQEKGHVLCHDPAFKKEEAVSTSYALKDFLEAWERSRRLVYLADPVKH